MPEAQSTVPLEVTCAQVKSRLDAGERFLLVDCRESEEYRTVHIAQATLIPLSSMATRVSELEPHRNADIVVHCHHGGRSLKVVNWLRQQGFSKAQNLTGGIDQWALEIDPSLPRY